MNAKFGPILCPLFLEAFVFHSIAANAVKVAFTLNTTDVHGAPIAENRYYYLYRPDNLSKTTPLPMILIMEAGSGGGASSILNTKAGRTGFVVVSCSFSGNSTGTPGAAWNAGNPRITGFEDIDYTTEVINRVRASDNCNDAFITGVSKGGHMAFAYACERPSMIKAAGPVDEFMGLTSNIPTAPVPMIVFQGAADAAVPYAMVKDSVDAWRATDGVLSATPVTTYEASPLIPGQVSQATWGGGIGGTQVAFVTIIGGAHAFPTPAIQTGYNVADGLWAFFGQYLTSAQPAPRIVSPPVDNVQTSGHPASFRVAATGNAPLSYQWQKNGVNIPGATANWYSTLAARTADDGAIFRAVVSNLSGHATSASATLKVNPASAGPRITAQPTDRSVAGGQPVSFSVSATGAGALSYQWQKNGVNVLDATAPSLTVPAALTADCGAAFRVVVTDSLGSVTSARATLSVTPAPGGPVILTNPERARVLPGQTATFSITARGASLSYQWQKGGFLTNMVDIPGATAATYTTPADHRTLFRCIVTNPAGSATSANELLLVTSAVARPQR
jgi:poly(3-hydroxybutyrate) depolymerase